MQNDEGLSERLGRERPATGELLTRFLSHRAKLRVDTTRLWRHHRAGWDAAVGVLGETLHTDDGVRFLSSVEETMYAGEVVTEPWVGFVHEAPHHRKRFPDLDRLLSIDTWRASIRACLGLWTLTDYQRRFLRLRGVSVPISRVTYPTIGVAPRFDFSAFERRTERPLLFIGEYLRRPDSLSALSAPGYRKILLGESLWTDDRDERDRLAAVRADDEITLLDRVPDAEYDRYLAEGVVFLDVEDAVASTTVVECIARATPLLVNKVGALPEYLGDDYPFYYDDLDEAAAKLADDELIASTVNHLRRSRAREELSYGAFVEAVENTAVYRMLPVPRSQETDFPTFDVTVMVISHSRTADLAEVLSRLGKQDFDGTVEFLVWNNNPAEAAAVEDAARTLRQTRNVKIVHSSENYYCIVRLAAATLMRSEALLICDDDVLAEPSYISTFVSAYQRLGPHAAICARGNVLLPHALDEDRPEATWGTGENVVFFDESAEERLVHYMHADACLIPRGLLQAAAAVPMPRADVALVDDYWLSYVLSDTLGVPLWKIRCEFAYSYSASSELPGVALYRRPRVREELVNTYVHHMMKGWPFPAAGLLRAGRSQRVAQGELRGQG